MPAAAVIPAPIAYIKVVAVKKLVVEPWVLLAGASQRGLPSTGRAFLLRDFYFEKIRVFKAGICSDTLAWNNRIGRFGLFCWLTAGRND